MTVKRRRKARGTEKRAKEYWEKMGYVVEITRPLKFGQQDFFSLFDLICVKKGHPTLWVQVKTNQSICKTFIEPITKFATENFDKNNIAILMVWYDKVNEWKFYCIPEPPNDLRLLWAEEFAESHEDVFKKVGL